MIRIQKPSPPQVLIDNHAGWTQSLLDAVRFHGGYSNIPDAEKKSLLVHYKHRDIQELLFASSHQKCVFCECKPGECSNIEVEHFQPKSIYPNLAFDWNNLLPICRKCNEAKFDFDTQSVPIINPAQEDPESLLTYLFLRMMPIVGTGEETKAQKTIDVCNLNCDRLYEVRASLLKTMTEYIDELREKFEWISEADTHQKKQYRITKLSNSLEIIDAMLRADNAFSGYCKWLIKQFPEYQEAKRIVQNR